MTFAQKIATPVLLFLIIGTSVTYGATYYVSNSGLDTNDGLTPANPWRTISHINKQRLSPGDAVLFQRGNTWREQLRPYSGDATGSVRYGAYGSGEKPLLLGSVDRSKPTDWHHVHDLVWSASVSTRDVGNIIFNDDAACGMKKWSENDFSKQGDFFFDPALQVLKLYSRGNPGAYYKRIECALRRHIINQGNTSYVIYEKLALKYGAAHGIGGGNTHNIIVRNCDLAFIGGGDQYADDRTVRYGNGIEFWGNAHDNLVKNCRLWAIYDAALTNQNNRPNVKQYNISYRNNTIWNCEYSYEYWNKPENSKTYNIIFENNTCLYAGYGWGHNQRPDPSGRHLCFYKNLAVTKNIVIRNNIFYEAASNAFFAPKWPKEEESLHEVIMDNNCWHQAEGIMIQFTNTTYTMDDFSEYQKEWGKEKNSTTARPDFINSANHDYRQKKSSACIDSGVTQDAY